MRRAECPPTTNKCLRPTQTSLSVRRTYPLAECGYPHIRLVWSRTTKLAPTNHRRRPPGRSQRTELQVWLGPTVRCGGESGAVGRGAHAVLPLPGHGLVHAHRGERFRRARGLLRALPQVQRGVVKVLGAAYVLV